MPELDAARELWGDRLDTDILRFEKTGLLVEWGIGPDSLAIAYGGEAPRPLPGFFLNINATDFGIEVDRIAHLDVSSDATLLDGELNDGRLINRPIGLFEVDNF